MAMFYSFLSVYQRVTTMKTTMNVPPFTIINQPENSTISSLQVSLVPTDATLWSTYDWDFSVHPRELTSGK